jgi:hypothetical protein
MQALGDILHEGLHAIGGTAIRLKFLQQFLIL